MIDQRTFESVSVGDGLDGFATTPTPVQLMRYCGVTWNMHRIHFDVAHAAEEGYPGLIVQSHLHQALLTKLITDWMGAGGRLRNMDSSVRRFAIVGEELGYRGTVIDKGVEEDGYGSITVEVEEFKTADGTICAPGRAVIDLPVGLCPR